MLVVTINGTPTVRYRQANCTQYAFVSRLSLCVKALLACILLTMQVAAQEDTIATKAATEIVQEDSLSQEANMEDIQLNQLPEKTGTEEVQTESLLVDTDIEAAQEDSPSKENEVQTAQKDTVLEKEEAEKNELVNIAKGNRKVHPKGWGEYRVGGRCLCCDNKNDGDCIVVHTIERTNSMRINQILDGEIEGDTSNSTTYFGDLKKRDLPEPVSTLMANIPLGKMYEIRKVIVYTMIDNEKRANFLSNCELGYYDQFNRLQWLGMVKSKEFDEPITFEMKNPVMTNQIMLRVKGGKCRITEVAILSDKKKNEKE